jgi:hypothetical protein
MKIDDLKEIAYTFARYSYQYNSYKPYYASKTQIYANQCNCDNSMAQLMKHDYVRIRQQAEEQDWAHKYIDIDECSDESDLEIRGYDREDHSNDYVMIYRYMSYTIYHSKKYNAIVYRGFIIYPIPEVIDGRIEVKFSITNTEYETDFDRYDSISETIDVINNFLSYMKAIDNNLIFNRD